MREAEKGAIEVIMSMQLPDDARKQALASIMRYCSEHTDLEIGNLEAVGLLDFILKEIAPSAYNASGWAPTDSASGRTRLRPCYRLRSISRCCVPRSGSPGAGRRCT